MATSIVIIIGQNNNQNEGNLIKETFKSVFSSDVYNWIGQSQLELRANMHDLKTIKEWLDKFSECKFIVVFYLSSSQSDGPDEDVKDIRDIKRSFFNPLFKIRELNDKLKWLVVPSCHGNLNYFNGTANMLIENGLFNKYLYLRNYLISYCMIDNPTRNRENVCGPLFIQVLCRELKNNAHKETLVCIFENVNDEFEKYARNKGYKEFPCPVYEKNFEDYTFC